MFAHHDTDRANDEHIGEHPPVFVPWFMSVHAPGVVLQGGNAQEESQYNHDEQEERRKLQGESREEYLVWSTESQQ